jgi:5-methylcytosine-specific restriction endonuclease McrA
MLGRNLKRDGDFTGMLGPVRHAALRLFCEVCGERYGGMVVNRELDGHLNQALFLDVKQIVDHIFPRRFLAKRKLDPHVQVNLLSLCSSCHGKKKIAETRIFAGDVHGFMKGLNKIGYPMERVVAAARHYGFPEIAQFKL